MLEVPGARIHIAMSDRRQFMLTAAAAGTVLPLFGITRALAEGAAPTSLERTLQFHAAFAKLVGSRVPTEGKITLELPEVAENGNFVPVTISVDSPMTPGNQVKAIHLLSTSNPVAHVASFWLSDMNGVARVQSRMRLAKTQDVIALAEMSDGTLSIATMLVKVTLGGCQS